LEQEATAQCPGCRKLLAVGGRGREEFEEDLRRQNGNTLKRAEGQQVGVAADEVSGAAADGQFDELVILRVATSGDLSRDFHPFGCPDQRGQKLPDIFVVHILAELLAAQDFIELVQHIKRQENLTVVESPVKGSPRDGFGEEQSADENVGV
jgi:hypothetical protein